VGKLTKQIGRKPWVQRAVAALTAGYMAAVRSTTRWRAVNEAVAIPAWAGTQPVIVAFWHNRLAMMPACWPSPHPFHMLISSHPDGRLIANTVAHFGYKSIAGSSTRGGGDAMRAMVKALKAGESVGVTPDGPRGPRMNVGDGIIALARLSGASILPLAVSIKGRVVLNTWDRLILPLPFSSGTMIWGNPITVPRDADDTTLAALKTELENTLIRISAEADAMVGHSAMTKGGPNDKRKKRRARA